MLWELLEFKLDEATGPFKVFNYEVALKGHGEAPPQVSFRGDGIYQSGGTVRLNREDEIRDLLTSAGVNPEALIEHLQVCVRTRAEKLLKRRIAAAAAPAPVAPPVASNPVAAQQASAFAFMWRLW